MWRPALRLGLSMLTGAGNSFLRNGEFSLETLIPILPALCIGSFFVIVFGGIVLLVLRVVFEKANRKADTVVRRAEGKVNFVWVERQERNTSKTGPMYRTVRSLEMRVGSENAFNNVNSRLPNFINQTDEWIFYYTNHPFKIISAEKVK